MFRLRISLALLLSTGVPALAAPGGSAGSAAKKVQTASPDYGLCMNTPVNRERPHIKDKLCQQIMESMNNEPCLKERVESLYKKATEKPSRLEGLSEWCPDSEAFTGNIENFKLLLMNMQAALWEMESGWESIPARIANPRTGRKAVGIAMLDLKSAKGYPCICKGELKMRNDLYDDVKSVRCGAEITLSNMDRDSAVGHGKNGDKNSEGLAKFHEPARDSSKRKPELVAKVSYYCSTAKDNPIAYSPFRDGNGRTRMSEGPATGGGGGSSVRSAN